MDLPISTEQIKNRLLNTDKQAKTLLEAFEYHNALLKSKIGIENTKATYTKYESLKKKISLYITEELKRKDVFLKELNHQFVVGFEIYLKTHDKLTHNPAIKYIQFLKKVIHLSVANGWILNNPFQNFKCSLHIKDRGYLSNEELKLIENKKIEIQRLAVVKDLFIFSCYTGLSYSDLKKLSSRHMENKEDGTRWIVINRTKTGVRSAIPLLEKASEIMERYEPPFIPDEVKPIFPVLSNQKMNAYLKEIGDLCKISKNLTFHLARHTFATTITLTNGVPLETVSKMMGHTNLKTTQHYSKVVDSKTSFDMDALKKRLNDRG
jgi:integrase